MIRLIRNLMWLRFPRLARRISRFRSSLKRTPARQLQQESEETRSAVLVTDVGAPRLLDGGLLAPSELSPERFELRDYDPGREPDIIVFVEEFGVSGASRKLPRHFRDEVAPGTARTVVRLRPVTGDALERSRLVPGPGVAEWALEPAGIVLGDLLSDGDVFALAALLSWSLKELRAKSPVLVFASPDLIPIGLNIETANRVVFCADDTCGTLEPVLSPRDHSTTHLVIACESRVPDDLDGVRAVSVVDLPDNRRQVAKADISRDAGRVVLIADRHEQKLSSLIDRVEALYPAAVIDLVTDGPPADVFLPALKQKLRSGRVRWRGERGVAALETVYASAISACASPETQRRGSRFWLRQQALLVRAKCPLADAFPEPNLPPDRVLTCAELAELALGPWPRKLSTPAARA